MRAACRPAPRRRCRLPALCAAASSASMARLSRSRRITRRGQLHRCHSICCCRRVRCLSAPVGWVMKLGSAAIEVARAGGARGGIPGSFPSVVGSFARALRQMDEAHRARFDENISRARGGARRGWKRSHQQSANLRPEVVMGPPCSMRTARTRSTSAISVVSSTRSTLRAARGPERTTVSA